MEDAVQQRPTVRFYIRRLLPFIFIFIIFAAYSNTFTSPPCLDDFHSFIFEKKLYLEDFSLSSILALADTEFGLTRFIPMATFALNHKLGQGSLIHFHVTNITIHVLAFLAVLFLAKQILSVAKKRHPDAFSAELAGWLPICVAALWALNPLQTNAVTYLVQRMASIQALLYFLAVGFYLKGRIETSRRKRSACFTGLAFCALCALFSKENSVLLPFSIALAEIWFFDAEYLRKLWSFARRRSRLTWVIVGLAAAVILFFAFGVLSSKLAAGYAKRAFTLSERVMTEWRIVIWYISLLFWPVPERLALEHYVDISTSLLNPFSTLLSLITILALIGGSICMRRKYPIITFGIMWYFLNLASESTIWPLELIFEHRLYVPSFGLFLSAVAILAAGSRYILKTLPEVDFAKILCCFLLVLASGSAILTFVRNEDWHNRFTLLYDGVLKAPQLPRTNANFANVLIEFGQNEEALKYAEEAMRLGKPGLECYAVSSNAIVGSLFQMGKHDEALARGEELLSNHPKTVDGDAMPALCLTMASGYMNQGRETEAYTKILRAFEYIRQTDNGLYKKENAYHSLRTLLEICRSKKIDLNGDGVPDPGEVPIGLWIYRDLERVGDIGFAKLMLETEHAKDPDNVQLAELVAETAKQDSLNRAQAERFDFSGRYIRRPFSRFNFCMAVAFTVQSQHMSEFYSRIGERFLKWALQLEPNSPDALLLAGWYAFQEDRAEDAVAWARKALKQDSENARVWLGLGFFLAKTGEFSEAASAFTKVIEIYPGYSRRSVLETLTAKLRKGENIEPSSSAANEGTINASLSAIPTS